MAVSVPPKLLRSTKSTGTLLPGGRNAREPSHSPSPRLVSSSTSLPDEARCTVRIAFGFVPVASTLKMHLRHSILVIATVSVAGGAVVLVTFTTPELAPWAPQQRAVAVIVIDTSDEDDVVVTAKASLVELTPKTSSA